MLTLALASHAPALGATQAAQGPGASKQRPAGDLRRQGFLGAQDAPVPDDIRTRLNVPAAKGVLVMRVERGAAALDAGLLSNDVIVRVDDAPVASTAAFVAALDPFRAGQGVRLTALSGRGYVTMRVEKKGTGDSEAYSRVGVSFLTSNGAITRRV